MPETVITALLEAWNSKLVNMKFVEDMTKTETARVEGEYARLRRCIHDLTALRNIFSIKP